jgi:hypothetical protein
MSFVTVAPWIAALAFVAFGAIVAVRSRAAAVPTPAGSWRVPAVACTLFAAFTLVAATREGALGFWVEHTRNLWGIQIWFDLLLFAAVGWFFVLPRARAAGMRPLPWLLAVAALGSIGMLAMVARLLLLESRRG